MIKVIKKADVERLLFDDPEWHSIERNIKSLNQRIEERPERYERIQRLLKLPENSLSRESELV